MLLAEAILGPILLSSMLAQSSGTPTQSATDQNSRQIDDMARRLDALEKRNAELQGQVVELKSQNGEQWLTEERAAEVRELVKDPSTSLPVKMHDLRPTERSVTLEDVKSIARGH